MRILFLHEVDYNSKPIFEMHEVPEHLAARGHDVGFMHFARANHASKSRTGWRRQMSGRVVSDSRITLYTPLAVSEGVPGRILATLLFWFQFVRVLRDFQPDVVVSFSVPTTGWQAVIVCRLAGVPILFRALDVSHKLRRTSFGALVKLAERFIYKNANWVSANNPALLEYCIRNGASIDRSSLEYPPMDVLSLSESSHSPTDMRSIYGIPSEAQVIVFLGTFFRFSGLVAFAEQFRELAHSGFHLLLLGGGEGERRLRSAVDRLGVADHVTFAGFVEFEKIPSLLQSCDVAINPMEPTLVTHSALPNKVIQYLAAGLPVVSSYLQGSVAAFEGIPAISFASTKGEFVERVRQYGMQGISREVRNESQKLVCERFNFEKNLNLFESRIRVIAESLADA